MRVNLNHRKLKRDMNLTKTVATPGAMTARAMMTT